MKIKIFGVRGSIPSPGPKTKRYGGNTTSILVELNNNDFIIIDAGTGIRELGKYLLATYKPPFIINLLITHTHWDHIMGLPFFTPIYMPGTKIKFWGPLTFQDKSLKELIVGQMTYQYFPVNSDEVAAEFTDQVLKEEIFEIYDCTIQTIYLNHPILTLGYKFIYNDKTFVTCYDHEMYQNMFTGNELGDEKNMEADAIVNSMNNRINNFIKGAYFLLHDAQYTKKEYFNKYRGWGHSYYEYVFSSALNNYVDNIIFTHHDPDRSDYELDYLGNWLGKQVEKTNKKMKTFIAKEGDNFEF